MVAGTDMENPVAGTWVKNYNYSDPDSPGCPMWGGLIGYANYFARFELASRGMRMLTSILYLIIIYYILFNYLINYIVHWIYKYPQYLLAKFMNTILNKITFLRFISSFITDCCEQSLQCLYKYCRYLKFKLHQNHSFPAFFHFICQDAREVCSWWRNEEKEENKRN